VTPAAFISSNPAPMLLQIFILSGRFVRLVMANDATRGSTENAVVTSIVTGNAAHQSAFYASFGVGRSRHARNRERDCSASNNFVHKPTP